VYLAVFTYGFSATEACVRRAFGASGPPEKIALESKHLPNQIIRSQLAPYTDKAQFQVGKYRNDSRQVAIDQTGKIV
jgi:hypothetical protein